MTFIPIYPASHTSDSFLLFPTLFLLACAGFVFGHILEKKVRGKFMIIGSAVYWVFTLPFLSAVVRQVSFTLLHENPVLYHSFNAAFWSTFLVLFADITYVAKYIVGKRKKQPLR